MKSIFGMLLGLTAVVLLVMPSPVAAQTSAHEQIRALGTCYARGTDAIGYAVDYPDQGNTDAPDLGLDDNFSDGLALYRECFAKDFEFNIVLTSGFFIGWADLVDTPDGDRPLQWANFVNNTFRRSEYVSTQHQLGSLFVSVSGNTGVLEWYLTATHARGPGSVSVAFGTYFNEVVREQGKWKIKSRTLTLRDGFSLP